MELELGGSDPQVMAVDEHRVVDFLVVDIRAVAAAGVANVPGAAILNDDCVYARAERIAQGDRAFRIAADARFVRRIEQKTDAGSAADRHRQVIVHGGCACLEPRVIRMESSSMR